MSEPELVMLCRACAHGGMWHCHDPQHCGGPEPVERSVAEQFHAEHNPRCKPARGLD